MSVSKVEITCPWCVKQAIKDLSRVKRNLKAGIKTYCSRECWRQSQTIKNGLAKDRLMERVVVSDSGCWIWQAGKTARGYGRLNVDGTTEAAHRFSYKIHKGEISKGLFVCHICDTPSCVNPNHLFLGTAQDNSLDMISKNRNSPTKKLTPDVVLQIRNAWKTTCMSYSQLVNKFNLSSAGHARKIILREIWKTV